MNFIKTYLWLIVAGLTVAAFAALAIAYKAHANGLREEGRVEIRTEWQAAENDALRERNNEIARLITANTEIQNEYLILNQERLAAVDSAERSKRLRNKAEHDAAVAGATAGALAEHARTSERNIGGLEDDANKMADRAVRATANSEALAATLQSRRPLRTPSMPTSPFNPTE